MLLIEKIEDINKWLSRDYPHHSDGRPLFRVVWSEDQFEKRWVTHTDSGFELLNPVVKEVPKYRQYIQGRYILERIVTIIPGVETDLVEREPYEVMWVFQDRHGEYLPPRYDACKIVIEQVYENMTRGVPVKKEDPEAYEKRIKHMEDILFGDESPVTDALHYKEGVVVPGKSETIH